MSGLPEKLKAADSEKILDATAASVLLTSEELAEQVALLKDQLMQAQEMLEREARARIALEAQLTQLHLAR